MQRIRAFLIALLYCSITTHADNINFTHLTVKDGLLNSTVYYAMQDVKGFIWFCTETGVSRYDGARFENFTINEGLADNEIFKCYEDSKGRIWFLSYNGKLSFYFAGRMYNSDNTAWLRYPVAGAFLLTCLEDKNGTIWISNSIGETLKISDTLITTVKSPFPEINHNDFYITSYIFNEHDSVKKFVTNSATNDIYLLNLLSNKLSYIGKFPPVAKPLILSTYLKDQYKKNDMFFVTDQGFATYKMNIGLNLFDLNEMGVKSKLLSYFRDENNLWLATDCQGVLKIDLHSGNCEKSKNMLLGEMVTNMMKDDEGNLWFITHNNGVFILKNNTGLFTTLPTQNTFSIKALAYQNKKIIVCGGNNGNISITYGDGIIYKKQLSSRRFNRIIDIIPYKNSKIFIGCDEGLYQYDIATNNKTKYSPHLLEGYKSYANEGDTGIWFCSQARVLKWVNNKFTIINNSLEHRIKFTAIAVISDSVYYLGTTSKLFKLVRGVPETILDDSILKTQVSSLKMVNNILWVATHGNGIFIIKNDKILKHITAKTDNIMSDICQKLYDDEKFVWLATNKGISVIDKNTFRLYNNISSDFGLASNDIKDIYTFNNFVYVATAEGTNILKISDLKFNTAPPRVYVTGFKKDDKYQIDPGDHISFDYFKGFINISFTAVSFQSPENIQYQYKFANETNWHKTLSTDIPLFTLTPGSHTLLFRAKKPNSSWSLPVLLTIKVNPLWYQATSFRITIVLVILCSVYYIVYKRIQHIQKRVKEENELNRKITELENKSLATQMNPHFIFNSLNTVQQLILVKEEQQGLNYLSDFAMLMRQILENSRKPFITLREEIQFLDRYMQLEKIRFNNRFEYKIKLDENLQQDEINIPPVLLQPILENAVKYGISSIKTQGLINLEIYRKNGFLIATIDDNGIGINSGKDERNSLRKNKESTALKLLEERLKLTKNLKGQSGSVKITDKSSINSEKQGTIVEIQIPL